MSCERVVFIEWQLFIFMNYKTLIIFFRIPLNQQCSRVNVLSSLFLIQTTLFSICWCQIINMYILFRFYGKRPLSRPGLSDLCFHYIFLIPPNQQCSRLNFFVQSFWYKQYNQHGFVGKYLLFSIYDVK